MKKVYITIGLFFAALMPAPVHATAPSFLAQRDIWSNAGNLTGISSLMIAGLYYYRSRRYLLSSHYLFKTQE